MAEENIENLDQLNKDQLQQKLKSYGISAVLTPGSIPIYRRKLAKLMGINKPEEEESSGPSSTSQPKKQVLSSPTINRQQPPTTQPLFKHPSPIDSPLPFFVVFNEEKEGFVPRLFHDIKLMMKFSKKNGARFKRFSCEAEAQDFLTEQIEKPFFMKEAKPISAPADKCPFKTPMMQDMNVFRRAIELGNLDEVDRLAHSNPLYLITQCDSAVIYKPLAGYTAMHISAKENKPMVVRKIVEIISNKDYVTSLRPNSNLTDDQIQASISHILDYYFNLPERVQNETALHLASKMGFTDVVEELISYKWCKKDLKNKYNETAYDLAGKKCPDEKVKIQKLLEEKFYIPLLRAHDNSVQAKVLQPVASFDIYSDGVATSQISSDNVLQSSPVVAAVAGPFTTRNEAYDTYVKWSSPDRRRKKGLNAFPIRSSDLERGEERIGRKLAKESGVKWIEFWDFIGEYTDMSSTDGLDMLEQFLNKRSKRLNNLTTMQQGDDNSSRLCATCAVNKQKGDDEKGGAGDRLISTPVQKCRQCSRIQLWSGGEDVESRQRDRLREKLVEDRKEQLHRLLSDDDRGKDDSDEVFSTLSSSFMSLSIKSPPSADAAAREDSADEPAEGGQNIYAERMNIDGYSTPTSQNNRPIFLSGCFPSKLDRDVSLAIEKELVNSQNYPLIAKWLITIEKYSQKEQQSWRTPRKSSTRSSTSSMSASRPLQLQFS